MATLPSHAVETSRRHAPTLTTYFLTRIALAILLTGIDILVFLKSATEGLRNSLEMPLTHFLLVVALFGIGLSLAVIWYKTLRYRQPPQPNTLNPFL